MIFCLRLASSSTSSTRRPPSNSQSSNHFTHYQSSRTPPFPNHALKKSPPPHFNLLVVIIDIRRCWLCQRTHTLNIHPIHNLLLHQFLLFLQHWHNFLLQELTRLLDSSSHEQSWIYQIHQLLSMHRRKQWIIPNPNQ